MSRLRVLIIDDDSSVCEFLIELLFPDDVDASASTDPFHGLEMLRSDAGYHVLILDLKMPGINGIALLERIREFNHDIAVIVITAYPSLESATDAVNLDVSAYMQKPFSGEDLRETLARVTRKRGITVRAEDALHIAVGKRIHLLRKQRGLTLRRMGRRAHLSVVLLGQIERAETSPALSTLYRIARALEVDILELFVKPEPPSE